MKTTKEAAEILGVSPRRIVALLSEGVLAGERVGKMWLVDEASIARRLERASNAGRPRLGSAACQTRFVLKNRTHSIMELVYDSDIREFTWAGPLIDSERAPLGLAMERDHITLPSFNVWWKNRGIPEGRAGVERLLEEAGVSVPSELAVRSLGLSLSDQYWPQPEGSDIEWRDVNFFMNDFEDVRVASWEGDSARHPDNTSDGNLPKHWIIGPDGTRILLKGGIHANQEPHNAVVATALHRRIVPGGSYVAYWLEHLDDGPASACAAFVRDDEEYVPAVYVASHFRRPPHRSEYQHYVACCQELGIEEVEDALSHMIVCDDILANTDRHARNYGVIRNVETLEYRIAPLFDSGTSLWCTKDLYDLRRGDYSFEGKQFKSSPAKQLMLAGDLSWLDVSALDGFVDEAMGILAQNERIQDRLEHIRRALEFRVERMVTIREALG